MKNATTSRTRARLLWPLALFASSLLLTWLAYGRTLNWPWIFDDPIHLRWLEDRTLLRLWTDATYMQHYRPLVNTLWWLYVRYVDLLNPWGLNLLSMLLHALNGVLVGWLASKISKSWLAAFTAAALFVLYPLSYQVLPSPGSQSKPVSCTLILLACWLYWQARTVRFKHATARTLSLAGACLLAVLAPFGYESAITAGGFLTLTEALLWRTHRVNAFARWSLAAPLLGLPFLCAFLLVPSSYDPLVFPGFEALWQSSIYFAQGLTWPVTLLAKPVMMRYGLSDGHATALVAYATLAVLAALYLWRGSETPHGPVFLFTVVWVILALSVQWVTLSFRYIIDAPRILYLPAAGTALLWADLLAWSWRSAGLGSQGRRWLGRTLTLGTLAALLLWGGLFIHERMVMIEAGVDVLENAADIAAAAEQDDALLFINVPSWLTPLESDLALGHEGYLLLPSYYSISLEDYLTVNRGLQRHITSVSLPDLRQPWKHTIGYHDKTVSVEGLAPMIREADSVMVLDYGEETLTYQQVGGLVDKEASEPAHPLFDESLGLASLTTCRTDEGLALSLTWSCHARVDAPYTAFVHLYAPDGHLLAQSDGYPLGGCYPFALWRPGEQVRDLRLMALPEAINLDGCTLGVGIYRGDTGKRAPAVDAQGQRLAEDVFRQGL